MYVLFGVQDKPNQTGEKGLIFIHVEENTTDELCRGELPQLVQELPPLLRPL